MLSFLGSALALAAALPYASAQTYTSCNPLKKTCPSDKGLNQASYTANFAKGASAMADWTSTAGNLSYGNDGGEFIIKKRGDAPTIQTDFYIFFGKVEVKMKAASGQGIVSSIVLESDDLDEIDWEFTGGDTAQGQTNFFGKGNTTTYDRGDYHAISEPQNNFYTYGVEWTSKFIKWSVNRKVIRTVSYNDALALGGKNFPQTPMNVRLGIWAGGDKNNTQGTIGWAGGLTNYGDCPFTMYVESVTVHNYNPGCEYVYSDRSGSFDSIEIKKNCDSSSSSSSSAAASSTASATATATGSYDSSTTGDAVASSTVDSGSDSTATTQKTAATTVDSGSDSGSCSCQPTTVYVTVTPGQTTSTSVPYPMDNTTSLAGTGGLTYSTGTAVTTYPSIITSPTGEVTSIPSLVTASGTPTPSTTFVAPSAIASSTSSIEQFQGSASRTSSSLSSLIIAVAGYLIML